MNTLDELRASRTEGEVLEHAENCVRSVREIVPSLKAITSTFEAALTKCGSNAALATSVKTEVLTALATYTVPAINGWNSDAERRSLISALLRLIDGLTIEVDQYSADERTALAAASASIAATFAVSP